MMRCDATVNVSPLSLRIRCISTSLLLAFGYAAVLHFPLSSYVCHYSRQVESELDQQLSPCLVSSLSYNSDMSFSVLCSLKLTIWKLPPDRTSRRLISLPWPPLPLRCFRVISLFFLTACLRLFGLIACQHITSDCFLTCPAVFRSMFDFGLWFTGANPADGAECSQRPWRHRES